MHGWLSGIAERRRRLAFDLERVEFLETIRHQPVTARYSHTQIARTETSDPTFRVVETILVQLPALREHVAEDARRISMYEAARTALPAPMRDLVVARYEGERSDAQAIAELGIAESSYFYLRTRALSLMCSILG